MNSLNSILLEGITIDDPSDTSDDNTKSCVFHISSHRFHKVNGVSVESTSNFTVEADAKIAETCLENLKKDHGVRVVGRLKTNLITIYSPLGEEDVFFEKVIIKAEHVEFKPVKKTDGN